MDEYLEVDLRESGVGLQLPDEPTQRLRAYVVAFSPRASRPLVKPRRDVI
jgi:hypothetical protein